MKSTTMDGEDETWGKSEAKKLLAKDIIEGHVTEDMKWQDVFWYRPEYSTTTHHLFSGRLKRLFKQISDAEKRAASDDAALAHDRALFPIASHNYRGELRWEGSAAQAWLKLDVRDGKHNQQKPKELYETRAAYREFPLTVFRVHIFQEVRFQKFCTWRNETKQRRATDWC